jgi:hypothetical protein
VRILPRIARRLPVKASTSRPEAQEIQEVKPPQTASQAAAKSKRTGRVAGVNAVCFRDRQQHESLGTTTHHERHDGA